MMHSVKIRETTSEVKLVSGDLEIGQFGVIAGGIHGNSKFAGKLIMYAADHFVLIDDPRTEWSYQALPIPLSRILQRGDQFVVTVGK